MDYKKLLARLAEKWPAKVISIMVAIILFAFHRMGDLQERFFSVPLRLDINSSLVPGTPYPRNIRVTIRGDNSSIYRIGEDDIEAYLDLSRYTEAGTYRASVEMNKKGIAAEVETLEISLEPAELTLELDTKMSKFVPISPDFKGYLETGYEMVSYTMEPSQMVLEGPMKLLTGIAELSTETIEIQGRNSDFAVRVRVKNPNPLLFIRGDGMTDFQAFVQELIMIKNFEELPISVAALGPGLKAVLDPPAASVRIQGAQNELDALDPMTILGVDCSLLTVPGSYELPLNVFNVFIPEGLTVDRLEPETIRITISRSEE
ncbi:hypothetical protein AGMMS50230_21670 [Spirochaetia bacterium]|nr:hypothetical protein AGMMS50230_21670 [Spirochaetia bacterium]